VVRPSRVHHLPPGAPWTQEREAAARPRELVVDPPDGDDADEDNPSAPA